MTESRLPAEMGEAGEERVEVGGTHCRWGNGGQERRVGAAAGRGAQVSLTPGWPPWGVLRGQEGRARPGMGACVCWHWLGGGGGMWAVSPGVSGRGAGGSSP